MAPGIRRKDRLFHYGSGRRSPFGRYRFEDAEIKLFQKPQSLEDKTKQSSFQSAHEHALSRGKLCSFTVWVPTAFFALVMAIGFFLHPHILPTWLLVLMAPGLTGVCAYCFSRFVFTSIQKQEEEILQRNRDLMILNNVGKILTRSLRIEEVLPKALDAVLEMTGLEAGEIFLWEAETEEVVLHTHRGLFPEAFREILRFKLGEGFPGRVAATGEPIVVRNLDRDPRFLRGDVVKAGFLAFASVPLKAKDRVVGVLNVAAFDPGRPTEDDLRLLTAIANQLGIAIENFLLSQQIEAMAVMQERERIAQELHDDLAQDLALLHLKIVQADQLLGDGRVADAAGSLKEMRQVAGASYDEVRQAIFGLRTMVSKGMSFIPTLVEYLHDFSELRKMPVDFSANGAERIHFAPRTEVQLIRIIHEALTNIFKHAQANRSALRFELDGDSVKVTIEDDGRGFDLDTVTKKRLRLGLQAMSERAESVGGKLAIKTAPGQGTKVIVTVPIR